MILKKAVVVGALVLAAALGPSAATAATITFASRAAFAAGVFGETVENWDSLANGTVIASLDGIGYNPSGGDAIVTNAFLELSVPNGLGSTSNTNFFGGDETMTFTFASPITAFGISFNTFATTLGAYTATTNLGDLILSRFDPFPSSNTGQFVGFSSDTAFSSVILTPITGFSYTLDDLNYVTAVPEPSSLLLFGTGAAAMVVAVRRRRKQQVQ